MLKRESVHLGMTGTRDGMTKEAKVSFCKFLEGQEITEGHHGDCKGADTDFHSELEKRKIRIVVHPPTNSKARSFCKGAKICKPKPYLVRNCTIVEATEMLVAFPPTKKEILRSGTWSTIRYAKKKRRKIIIFHKEGSVEET